MESKITLFYGTFVDLPRTRSGEKHELAIRHGAIWVSSATGRIQGFDWSIANEAELQSLLRKNGWTGVPIIRALEQENEFFFPGFIGMSMSCFAYSTQGHAKEEDRYTHSRASIPQFRPFRLVNPPRLVGDIYISPRELYEQP